MEAFNQDLISYCKSFEATFDLITPERKIQLESLGSYIISKQDEAEICKLTFICTHNSRRSQFGQIWAHTAALWYNLKNIRTYSGGTEATAFNVRAIAALIRAGFQIDNAAKAGEKNPSYWVRTGEDADVKRMFSKKYDHLLNPEEDFAAVMVCSDADHNCPFVPGAEKRFSIPYRDPKEFDETKLEKQKYDESCMEIGREMFFLMDYVKNGLIKNK